MDRFEVEFPQLIFLAYLADLPEGTNLRELGFWLLNRAIIDSPRKNDHAILLCVDTRSMAAGLSLGYVPERFVSEEALVEILEAGRRFIDERRFATLIGYCLNSLSVRLRAAARTG